MKKTVFVVVGIIFVIIGLFVLLRIRKGGGDGMGVLKIASTPQATIFLNNQDIGKTPYEEKHKEGEYTVKLVPDTSSGSSIAWEGKVTLNSNLLTYINRELKDTELTSAGEVLTLEKISGNNAEISVISTPDGAKVNIDNNEKGVTPLLVRDLGAGSYELTVSSIGFAPRTVKIKTTNGYKLTAVFSLASIGGVPLPSPAIDVSPLPSGASPKPSPTSKASPSGSAKPSPKVQGSPPPKPYVEIEETPTGFLRVRATAGASGEEVGRVNPGEFYALLDEQVVSQTPWYKIEYTDAKEGWVSSQYAKKFE